MTEQSSVEPAVLEEFLAGRGENADAAEAAVSGDLDPRHLVAVATGTKTRLDDLPGVDWESFLSAVGELPDEEEATYLSRMIWKLGTRTPTGIESEAGIRAIGDRAYELRYRHPHVFITFLHELRSLLRWESSPEAHSAAEEQFRRVATAHDHVSNERIESFREADIRRRLVSPSVNPSARVSLLETLAEEPVEEVPPDLFLDVLYPLRNQYDRDVEKAALETLTAWISELPTNQSTDSATVRTDSASERATETADATTETETSVVETLESHLAGEREEVPESILRELVVSGYVGPAIVEWLVDAGEIEKRQTVVATAFETLSLIPGLRSHADALCEFLLDSPLEPTPLHEGIELLGTVLLGLTPYQRTESPQQDDHVRRVLFTDEELAVDETIRETLREISEADDRYPSAVRVHATEVWLSVRPPEIQEVLWEIDPEDIGEDQVVDAKLAAAAEHRLVEFVDAVEDLWCAVPDDADRLEPLVDTLRALGTHDILRVLLDPAFDHDEEAIREAARDALETNGYEAEIDRERQRRTILDRIESRYETMSDGTETDREIRDKTSERFSLQNDRKRARAESAEATGKSVDTMVSFRANGSAQMLKLAPLLQRLKELASEIEQLRSRISQTESQIREEHERAEQIADDIERVETEIREAEKEIEQKKKEKKRVQSDIEEVERQTIPELEREINRYDDEIRDHRRAEPTRPRKPTNPSERQAERYERKLNKYQEEHKKWERKLDSLGSERTELQNDLDSARDDLSTLKRKRDNLGDDINDLENKLNNFRNEHRDLCNRLDQSKSRISQYGTELSQLSGELEDLQQQYQAVKSEIDSIVAQLNRLREEATSERDRLASAAQSARSNASSLRDQLGSVVSAQSSARDRRRRLATRVSQLTERLGDDHEQFETLGDVTETETPEADTTAYESARQARDEQYRQNVEDWRRDSIFRRSTRSDAVVDLAPRLSEQAIRRVDRDGGEQS